MTVGKISLTVSKGLEMAGSSIPRAEVSILLLGCRGAAVLGLIDFRYGWVYLRGILYLSSLPLVPLHLPVLVPTPKFYVAWSVHLAEGDVRHWPRPQLEQYDGDAHDRPYP
jgi:hypothetical protein